MKAARGEEKKKERLGMLGPAFILKTISLYSLLLGEFDCDMKVHGVMRSFIATDSARFPLAQSHGHWQTLVETPTTDCPKVS
jgi:hypothetical protein